eukprot:CAMPEP_0206460496 /NCGR_PEP_ID=MMETSP0324_2-20121206/24782_1 /ASSEMBLY_ACC=CAM_ASM_000836 /TAXON_ID=2866 /ORGANISM="Crypthecodinium cohnii, Strain Seligo" /LENGTH=495 /DNA_ID=CAMNT_0053932201 /DNA_START=174 /DNA_END=1661 /DNA_ORIENTATION=-
MEADTAAASTTTSNGTASSSSSSCASSCTTTAAVARPRQSPHPRRQRFAAHLFCAAATLLLARVPSGAAYQCATDIRFADVQSPARKGLAIDDTTFQSCSSRIPWVWPNTWEPVSSIRLFKAWSPQWPESSQDIAWSNLAAWVATNNATVLVGTQITCVDDDDKKDWEWTKKMLKYFKPSQVMGLAIGNELDILADKVSVDDTVTLACIDNLWQNQHFWKTFQSRVQEFDAMGFGNTPITSVFTGAALGGGSTPFVDTDQAKVNTFLTLASQKYEHRFAFTLNFYPYFDPNYNLDASGTCEAALRSAACFGGNCQVPNAVQETRNKIQQVTGTGSNLLWVGETGWSSPVAHSLSTAMANCKDWSSLASFTEYYKGFLSWNIQSGSSAPDHVFYFDVRDSLQYGVQESFGLIDSCMSVKCKIASANFTAPDEFFFEEAELVVWWSWAWLTIGAVVIAALLLVCLIVRTRVCIRNHKARSKARARELQSANDAAASV